MPVEPVAAGSGWATVQVLGSGGPMHGGGRGSAAYVLWRGGRPALILDMGGDTPLALARAGVEPADVPILLVSHLHPDHVSGLPGFFWGELQSGRTEPLTVLGPRAGDRFLDIETFFRRLFGPEGAFPDLQGLLDGGPFPLDIKVVDGDGSFALERGDLRIAACHVDHGRAPVLAFRIDGPDFSIVFAGDQTMKDERFTRFARGADLMVAHAVVTERAQGTPLSRVVALPADIGRTAMQAQVGKLVLSHFMGAPDSVADAALLSLADLEGVAEEVRRHYDGPVTLAQDLASFAVR